MRQLMNLLSLGALALATAAAGQQAGEDLSGNAMRGAERYLDLHCYACHGYSGETGSGERLNPPRMNQEGFIAYVRVGNMARRSPPAGSWMPAYAGSDVSDQDLADIYAWLTSLESTSPPVEEIPLLRDL